MSLNTANAALDILLLAVFIIGICYPVIAVFSFARHREKKSEYKIYRFAVCIAAHNEQAVMARLIKSIRACVYPRENICIFVAADGCNDMTAEIAQSCGAAVLRRHSDGNKGSALCDLFDFVDKSGYDYDCVVVFDADNTVDEYFFAELSDKLSQGYDAVQGYIDSQNPNRSWVSNAYSVWYWVLNRTMQMGFDRLGFGCRLDGTGFAVKREVLKRIPFRTKTLAEDREYTCYLALGGVKVRYAERAVVYDEKPISFKTSAGQRKRWARGVVQVQKKLSSKLIKEHKTAAFCALWYEPLAVLSYNIILCAALLQKNGIFGGLAGKTAAFIYLTGGIIVSVIALIKDKKFSKEIVYNLFGLLMYILSWLPIGIIGMISKGGWYHTKHGDAKSEASRI